MSDILETIRLSRSLADTVSERMKNDPAFRAALEDEGLLPRDVAWSEAQKKARAMVRAAVDVLVSAGMVVRYRSIGGQSWYLGLPGRSGTIRVSDHASPDKTRNDVVARVTFGPVSLPKSDDRVLALIAEGLGRYLLATGGVTSPPGSES